MFSAHSGRVTRISKYPTKAPVRDRSSSLICDLPTPTKTLVPHPLASGRIGDRRRGGVQEAIGSGARRRQAIGSEQGRRAGRSGSRVQEAIGAGVACRRRRAEHESIEQDAGPAAPKNGRGRLPPRSTLRQPATTGHLPHPSSPPLPSSGIHLKLWLLHASASKVPVLLREIRNCVFAAPVQICE